jgi:hypothetical protein
MNDIIYICDYNKRKWTWYTSDHGYFTINDKTIVIVRVDSYFEIIIYSATGRPPVRTNLFIDFMGYVK